MGYIRADRIRAVTYACLHGSRLREHNKISVDVDRYMGVTLSEWLVYSCLVFVVSALTTTAYTMKLSKFACTCNFMHLEK